MSHPFHSVKDIFIALDAHEKRNCPFYLLYTVSMPMSFHRVEIKFIIVALSISKSIMESNTWRLEQSEAARSHFWNRTASVRMRFGTADNKLSTFSVLVFKDDTSDLKRSTMRYEQKSWLKQKSWNKKLRSGKLPKVSTFTDSYCKFHCIHTIRCIIQNDKTRNWKNT